MAPTARAASSGPWLVSMLLLLPCLAGACGTASPPGPAPDLPATVRPRVLLVVSLLPAYTADLVEKLTATEAFDAVDVFEATAGAPTLASLEAHDSVLVVRDLAFSDRVGLGNVLADYLDAGGGIVLTYFAFAADTHPSGRFEADGYQVIDNGFAGGGDGPLGMTPLEDHPILQGVTSFDGGTSSYRPLGATVAAGATVVARWNDAAGTPLVATRTVGGRRRCDLGFFPPTSDTGRADFVQASTDAVRIVANALRWVAGDLP